MEKALKKKIVFTISQCKMEPHKQLWKPTTSAVSWSRSKFLSLWDLDIQQAALVRSLRVKLPPAHLSATRDGGFTLPLLIADRQA